MKMTQAKKKAFWQSLPATPYILWMALFIIIPLGMVVFFALTDPQGNFTLENIARGGEHMGVLLRSIKLAAIATALCVLIAYPLAYILSRKKGFQKQTLFIMVMLPMWMNFLLRTFAWMTILENNGLINKFLGLFGIGPLQMINTQGAVILGMVYNYIPFMILPIYTTMCKIGDDVIEAAQDLGGGVCAGHLHLYHFEDAGRRHQPAHRRHHRAAVSGQLLQPQPRLGHLAGADGGGAAVHEHHEQL